MGWTWVAITHVVDLWASDLTYYLAVVCVSMTTDVITSSHVYSTTWQPSADQEELPCRL